MEYVDMELVSIIMAVFNDSKTLSRCILSIIEQDYTNWEFIIVDDCSTDETSNIINHYASSDSRFKVIKNNKNLGLAASLNKAITISTGSFIARMDADDISLPTRLSTQLKYLLEHPDIDVLGTSAYDIDCNGNILHETICRNLHEHIVAHIYKENPFFHPSIMCRRTFYESMNGYNEHLRRCQDYDLWLRGYRKFKYHNLQTPLIYYYRRKTQKYLSPLYSSYVLLTSALREKIILSKGFYVLRPIIAYILARLKL